jgi:PPP family 3-phenylpropionic acid transporter
MWLSLDLEEKSLTAKRISPRRIEVNYAGVQSSFWLSQLAYTGFAAVFLASKGFSDTQIGVTSSLMSVISILFQLFTSSFSDMHNHIPIKKVMTVVFLLAMACGAVILAL